MSTAQELDDSVKKTIEKAIALANKATENYIGDRSWQGEATMEDHQHEFVLNFPNGCKLFARPMKFTDGEDGIYISWQSVITPESIYDTGGAYEVEIILSATGKKVWTRPSAGKIKPAGCCKFVPQDNQEKLDTDNSSDNASVDSVS